MSTPINEMEMCQRCFDVFKYHNSAGACMLCHRCDQFKRVNEMWLSLLQGSKEV
jgi:late competence protein required for DNA uptake (superfamily II DNA/RNA helicase)